MIKFLLFDFSRTLLFPTDLTYKGELNPLHAQLSKEPGYDFNKHFRLNAELLDLLKTLKKKYKLCIFTSGVIQDAKEIKPTMDQLFLRVFSAERMGLTKKDPAAYLRIAADLGVLPSEIAYIDDSQSNVDTAAKAGLNAYLFVNNADTIAYLKSL